MGIKIKLFFSLAVFLFVAFLIKGNFVFGQEETPTPTPEESDVQKRIEEYQGKITELEAEANTLSSQIGIVDNQIFLTELRIEDTEERIRGLGADIDITQDKISGLETDIEATSKALIGRIVGVYKIGKIDAWQALLSSDNISNFFTRLKYLRIVQLYDKKNIFAAEQARVSYSSQQEIFEEQQIEEEVLRGELTGYTSQLEVDRAGKEQLLEVTKNDEARYQILLAQAQAERAIVFGGGEEIFMRDVNQGDSIGSIASHSIGPGCSTGPHLHFEVQKDGAVQDPSGYLQEADFFYPPGYNTAIYRTISPNGNLPWPLNTPVQINQGFGAQPNSSFYGSAGHQGIDMGRGILTVKAVREGKLYRGSFQCTTGLLPYAKVVHSDGLTTWYLHMLPQ